MIHLINSRNQDTGESFKDMQAAWNWYWSLTGELPYSQIKHQMASGQWFMAANKFYKLHIPTVEEMVKAA
jgi:hypothetical protein